MDKKQFTINQHYIPRFILKNFTKDNMLQVADISGKSTRYFSTSPERICSEKDLYEIKNSDGTYFDRNIIEDRFSAIESLLAPRLIDLMQKYSDVQYQLDGEQDTTLAMLFALQLARLPDIKESIHCNDAVGLLEKNYIYASFVHSHQTAISYLNHNNVTINPHLLNDTEGKTLIDTIASYLLCNCFFYVLDATNSDEKFVIADQSVLITPYEDVHYLLPVSPEFAVACCKFTTARGNQAEGVVVAPNELVHKINMQSHKQCRKFLIAKEFTGTYKTFLEGKDDK